MRLGALIERVSHYRILGSVIEAACDRKWEVTCFHYRSAPQTHNLKSYLDAARHPVPSPLNGKVNVEEYGDVDGLMSLLSGVDAVISTRGPTLRNTAYPCLEGSPAGVAWFVLQSNVDTFEMGSGHLNSADQLLLHSPYWAEIGLLYARLNDWPAGSLDEFQEKSVFAGFPGLDALLKVDKDEVRRRHSIPEDRPVVTFLPIQCAQRPLTPWCKMIFAEESRLRQAWNAARHLREPRYLGHVWKNWNNRSVVQSVKKFCESNNYFLIIKKRHKDKDFDYEEKAADLTIYDDRWYPPLFLEVAAVSEIVIGSHSTAVMEALFAGTPYLLIDLPNPERHPHSKTIDWLERDDPALWRCEGAIWRMGLDSILEELPRSSLADFTMSAESRRRYVRRIIGEPGEGASQGALDAIAAYMAR